MIVTRFIFLIIFLFAAELGQTQSNFYRTYLQNLPAFGFYTDCNMPPPVRTSDQGYIFSFNAYSPGLHNYNALGNYQFKTDSNFVPQWKKDYSTKAIPLPTGGIILYWSVNFVGMNGPQYSIIEKVTASGQQVWCKIINSDTRINEGVQYNDKVRFVGGVIAVISQIPYTQYSNYPYTIELDTLGNLISQQVFTHPLGQQTEFKGIKRDSNGNFYVLGGLYYMVMAKFTPAFNPIWAKYHFQNNQQLYFIDSDVLSNGQIVCTGEQQSQGAVMMRLDSMGNILDQKLFPGTRRISGLCKLQNGNYAIGLQKAQDSLCLFETSTALNISNFRYSGKGIRLGTPILNQGALYFMRFTQAPALLKNNNNILNCMPTAPYTILNGTLQLSSFVLSPSNYTATISNFTSNPVLPQFYVDSCKCAAGITGLTNVCASAQSVLSLWSYGPISWYNVPVGGVPISTSPQYSFSTSSAGNYTLYAEDNSCLSLGRIPVTVTVQSQPTIAVTSSTNSACEGAVVTLSAQGALTYSWNTGQAGPVISSTLISGSNHYTVNGAGNNGCVGNNSISITAHPNPTILLTSTSETICASQSVTVFATGASTFTWNSTVIGNSLSVTPQVSQQFTVVGINQFSCNASQTLNISVYPNPTVQISANSTLICNGEAIFFTASGAQSFSWSNGQTGSIMSFAPLTSQLITVYGVNQYGCTSQATQSISVDQCLSNTDLKEQPSVAFFPNPARDAIYFIAEQDIIEVCLYNIEGQRLINVTINKNDFLRIDEYPAGIYFLEFRQNAITRTYKIVKQ
jgi:hypothetical protein